MSSIAVNTAAQSLRIHGIENASGISRRDKKNRDQFAVLFIGGVGGMVFMMI